MKENLYSMWVAFLIDMNEEKEAIKQEMVEFRDKNADNQDLFDMIKIKFANKMLDFRSKYQSLPDQITGSLENLDYFLYKLPAARKDLENCQDKLFSSITISQI